MVPWEDSTSLLLIIKQSMCINYADVFTCLMDQMLCIDINQINGAALKGVYVFCVNNSWGSTPPMTYEVTLCFIVMHTVT